MKFYTYRIGWFFLTLLFYISGLVLMSAEKPNIVLIYIDDLGY